jgi:hypothetical protein
MCFCAGFVPGAARSHFAAQAGDFTWLVAEPRCWAQCCQQRRAARCVSNACLVHTLSPGSLVAALAGTHTTAAAQQPGQSTPRLTYVSCDCPESNLLSLLAVWVPADKVHSAAQRSCIFCRFYSSCRPRPRLHTCLNRCTFSADIPADQLRQFCKWRQSHSRSEPSDSDQGYPHDPPPGSRW